MIRTLQKNGLVIQYIIPYYDKKTFSLILFYIEETLRQNGMALQYVVLLNDALPIVEITVNQNPKSIIFVSDDVKKQLLQEYLYKWYNPMNIGKNRRLIDNNTILPLLYYIKRRESDNIGFKEELQTEIDNVITNLNENQTKLCQYKKLINYKNSTSFLNSLVNESFPSGI